MDEGTNEETNSSDVDQDEDDLPGVEEVRYDVTVLVFIVVVFIVIIVLLSLLSINFIVNHAQVYIIIIHNIVLFRWRL